MKREIEEKGAGQSGRIQKAKGYYGHCVHPGPFSKERTEEEDENDGVQQEKEEK
jgi:hypothetical protein